MNPPNEKADPLKVLSHELRDELAVVDTLIRDRSTSDQVERIGLVADHLFQAGGKRMRPLLTLAMGRLFNGTGNNHIRLAAALEFIHTTTLLHDDVVDRSSQRRGRPTANLLWDNKSSILVGDFFFARAFQLMVATRSIEALSVLADSSATIAEAEVLQLALLHNIDLTENDYFRIIRGKTAALFAAAARVGALVAGASEKECDAAECFGNALGICYQIRDDVLDYSGAPSTLGKDVGDDFRDRKMTLPLVKAVATADQKERVFWKRVISRGRQLEGDLETALSILHSRGILEQVQVESVSWSVTAKQYLELLPEGPIRNQLADLAAFSANRSS